MNKGRQVVEFVHLCRREHDLQVEAGLAEQEDFDTWTEFMGECALKLLTVTTYPSYPARDLTKDYPKRKQHNENSTTTLA